MKCFLIFFLFSTFFFYLQAFSDKNKEGDELNIDPNGYIIFCLCMGRVGNQIEHLLGGMRFAKDINRTLIIPPFRTYVGVNRNVPFKEWFKFEPMKSFHRVIMAEEFMEKFAGKVWPQNKRFSFCWAQLGDKNPSCRMKEGNPFGPFWNELKVDFEKDVFYDSLDSDYWIKLFPSSEYPVISMKGAPASFPMSPDNWSLQKHLVFSERVEAEAESFIKKHFARKSFIGIHLRNGLDWENACAHAKNSDNFMASLQCLHNNKQQNKVTKEMCFPSKAEVLKKVKELVMRHYIKIVFVATDKNPMIEEIKNHLIDKDVEVFHADPWLPLVDWAILIESNHFIGNCVSSFSSFVKRARDLKGKPSYFWGLP